MITKDLVTYIKDAQKMGAERDGIERLLLENDWDYEDITEAFIAIENEKQGVAIKYDDELSMAPEKSQTDNAPQFTPNPVSMVKSENFRPTVATFGEDRNFSAQTISPVLGSKIAPEDKKVFDNKDLIGIPREIKGNSQEKNSVDLAKKTNKSKKIIIGSLLLVLFLGLISFGVWYLFNQGFLNQFLPVKTNEIAQENTMPDLDQSITKELLLLQTSLLAWKGVLVFNERIDFNFTSPENPVTSWFIRKQTDRGEKTDLFKTSNKTSLVINGAINETSNVFEGNMQFIYGDLVSDTDIKAEKDRILLSPNLISPQILPNFESYLGNNYLVSKADMADILGDLDYDKLPSTVLNFSFIPNDFWQEFLSLATRPELVTVSAEIDQITNDRIVTIDNPNQTTLAGRAGINQVIIRYNLDKLNSGQYALKELTVFESIPQGGEIKSVKNIKSSDSTLVIDSLVAEPDNQPFDLVTTLKNIATIAKISKTRESLNLLQSAAVSYQQRFGGYSAFCNTENVLNAIKLIGETNEVLLSCADSKAEYIIFGQIAPDRFVCIDKKSIGEIFKTPKGFNCDSGI